MNYSKVSCNTSTARFSNFFMARITPMILVSERAIDSSPKVIMMEMIPKYFVTIVLRLLMSAVRFILINIEFNLLVTSKLS